LQLVAAVSDASLDLAELESIQAALRAAAPSRGATSAADIDAVPLPLLASERDAASARPNLTELISRWTRRMTRIARSYLGEVELTPMGAEVVDAASLAEELRTMWTAMVTTERGGALVIAVGGEAIEAGAARRCGAASASESATREPSAIALKLFAPIGDAIVATLEPAWTEVFRTALTRTEADAEAAVAALGQDAALAATVMIGGATNGRIRVFARPEVLASSSPPSPTVPADAQAIATALGGVPVEVRVELATLRLRWSQLRALTAGTQLTLPVFVDDPLPIYCGDVLKAWGRPVVTRGVLAVEIAAIHVPGGGRP
jgi:flagellar motor switch/type III secretory pathway protein FliN